ncbi:MDR family MFS transporter [Clostridium sp. Ade.TY]|uniref:MDR family MFS transporter n=1 Tax=Clostridium sp. Ade.TY TaxID=1391647 RepID=UPI000408F08C|nr:MDR family MFS transporter [Clostridium sp. Ade.TY]
MAEEDKILQKKFNPILIAAVFVVGGFVSFLNGTLITTALPTIMRDLKIDPVTGQWLTTAFMLVTGIVIPCTAFLIDKFSTRKLFFGSMGLFTIGTILAGFSTSFEMLLAARIIQAIGAGIIMPLMQTVYLIIFPKNKRGVAMGVVGIIVAFAPAIGPTLAGFVVDNYPWRYLFHFITPICIIDLIFAFFVLKNVTGGKDEKLDFISLITSTVGFGGLLLGFSNAGNYGWVDYRTIVPILAGILCLCIFTIRQFKGKYPMLNLNVFKSKVFTYSTIVVMIVYAGLVSAELIIPMYIQMARGYSAFDSGLMLMPGAITMGILSPITGKIFDKYGARKLALSGVTLLGIGTLGLAFLTSTTKPEYITILYTIRLFGMAMFMMPVTTLGLNSLENKELAHGTAINNTLRQVAGSIGTAVLVTVMSNATANSGIHNKELATIHGMNVAFAVSAVLSFIGLVIVFFTIKDKKKVQDK